MVWPIDTLSTSSPGAASNPTPQFSFLESLNTDFSLPGDPVPSQTPQIQSSMHMPTTPFRQQLWPMSSGGGMALGTSSASQNQPVLAQLHATIARLEREKMEISLKHHEMQSRLCETEKALEKYVVDEARYGHEIPVEFDGPDKPEVFWYRKTYERLKANTKGLTGTKSTTNSEQLGYLVTPLGKRVSDEYEKTCLHYAYDFFNQLAIEGNTAVSWSFVPADMKERFYKFMEDHFHLLRISAHHWKADKLAKQYYANWRKSHLEFIDECQRKLKVGEYVKAVTTGLVEKVRDGSLDINGLTLVLHGLVNDDTAGGSFSFIKKEADTSMEVVPSLQRKRTADMSHGVDGGKRLRLDETATTTTIASHITPSVNSAGLLSFDNEDVEMQEDDYSSTPATKENPEDSSDQEDREDDKMQAIVMKNPLLKSARYSKTGLQDVTNAPTMQDQTAPGDAVPSGSTPTPPLTDSTAPSTDSVPNGETPAQADSEPNPAPSNLVPDQLTFVVPAVQVPAIPPIESTVVPAQSPAGPTSAGIQIAVPGEKKYQPNKKSITARALCGCDWAIRNPQGSTKQYAAYWGSVETENGPELKKWKALADEKKIQKGVGVAAMNSVLSA